MDPLVYVFEDDHVTAESICWSIESLGIEVKCYCDIETFFQEFDINQHGCLILDIQMIDVIGLEIQERLRMMKATLPIIFTSESEDISVIVKILKNGAFDFLSKPIDEYVLLECINHALKADQKNRKHVEDHELAKLRIEQLSPRELQVLQGIVDGKQNRAISAQLDISLKTIEAYRANLMKKMGVKSVSELVKLALSQPSFCHQESVVSSTSLSSPEPSLSSRAKRRIS